MHFSFLLPVFYQRLAFNDYSLLIPFLMSCHIFAAKFRKNNQLIYSVKKVWRISQKKAKFLIFW